MDNLSAEELNNLLFKWFDAEWSYRYFAEHGRIGDRVTYDILKAEADYERSELIKFLLDKKEGAEAPSES